MMKSFGIAFAAALAILSFGQDSHADYPHLGAAKSNGDYTAVAWAGHYPGYPCVYGNYSNGYRTNGYRSGGGFYASGYRSGGGFYSGGYRSSPYGAGRGGRRMGR